MKSEHRHDLKTNELADWVEHFPQWLKKNQKNLLYAVLVVCVALVLFVFFAQQKGNARKADEVFSDLIEEYNYSKMLLLQGYASNEDLPVMSNVKSNFAAYANSKNIGQAGLALIKLGDISRMEIHYRAGVVSTEYLYGQIDKAKENYNAAIEKLTSKGQEKATAEYGVLYAAAQLGLGMCEEELGNLDGAKKIYETLVAKKELDFAPAYADAEQRLVLNDYLRTRVKFIPSPIAPSLTIPMESFTNRTSDDPFIPNIIEEVAEVNVEADVNQ